jgi:hypothetical protein
LQRLFFASVALLAGNTALLLFLPQNGLRMRSALRKAHMDEPNLVLRHAWEIFLLYAIFSVVGWILIGVPTALVFPPRLLLRISWPVRVLIGAAMGPLALLLIYVILFAIQGRVREFSLAHTETLWPFSILVSAVAFVTYTVLLQRRTV